jgi:hypothetical protein
VLQVLRKKASNDPAFMFYHNPRSGIEEFLRTTSWLKPIQKSSDGEEFPFGNVADIFASAILGMTDSRNDCREYHPDNLPDPEFWCNHVKIPFLELRASLQSPFLGDGFPNFIMALLRRAYPTLRGRLFRYSLVRSGASLHCFTWGEPRDVRGPSFVVILGLFLSPPSISFMGNPGWAADRLGDLCACVGNGNLALAMSQHPRLGRDSWLGKLTKETLRGVVSFLL